MQNDTVHSLRKELAEAKATHAEEILLLARQNRRLVYALHHADDQSQVLRAEMAYKNELRQAQEVLVKLRRYCRQTFASRIQPGRRCCL